MKTKILISALARHDDITASTTFQLAKEFAKENEVTVLENPYTLIDLLKKDKRKLRIKATYSLRVIAVEMNDHIVIIPPAVLPINFLPPGKIYQFFRKVNEFIVSRTVNSFLKRRNWHEYHYINSYCYTLPSLFKFFRGKVLSKTYHCVDPIVKAYTKKHGILNEQEAVKNSDLVISTAKSLKEKWEKHTENSYLIPNAADYDHFSRKAQTVAKVRTLGKSIIGYFGNIERRIDYDLLYKFFSTRPEHTLLMAGPMDPKYVPKKFIELENVDFMGAYRYDDLPDLIHSIDATIIPFKCDQVSAEIYPLKLYEFLGTGKPVITTNFNPDLLLKVKGAVYTISNEAELCKAISASLKEKVELTAPPRQELAKRNTWLTRAEDFLSLIKHYQYAKSY